MDETTATQNAERFYSLRKQTVASQNDSFFTIQRGLFKITPQMHRVSNCGNCGYLPLTQYIGDELGGSHKSSTATTDLSCDPETTDF